MSSIHLKSVPANSPSYSDVRAAYDKWKAAVALKDAANTVRFDTLLTSDGGFAADIVYRDALDAELSALMEYERVRKGGAT